MTVADGIGCGKAVHQGFFSLLATCSVRDQHNSLLVKWLGGGGGAGGSHLFYAYGFFQVNL